MLVCARVCACQCLSARMYVYMYGWIWVDSYCLLWDAAVGSSPAPVGLAPKKKIPKTPLSAAVNLATPSHRLVLAWPSTQSDCDLRVNLTSALERTHPSSRVVSSSVFLAGFTPASHHPRLVTQGTVAPTTCVWEPARRTSGATSQACIKITQHYTCAHPHT